MFLDLFLLSLFDGCAFTVCIICIYKVQTEKNYPSYNVLVRNFKYHEKQKQTSLNHHLLYHCIKVDLNFLQFWFYIHVVSFREILLLRLFLSLSLFRWSYKYIRQFVHKNGLLCILRLHVHKCSELEMRLPVYCFILKELARAKLLWCVLVAIKPYLF